MLLEWIWFFGTAVWLVDAALAVHYDHRTHALASLGVAALFLTMGLAGKRSQPKP